MAYTYHELADNQVLIVVKCGDRVVDVIQCSKEDAVKHYDYKPERKEAKMFFFLGNDNNYSIYFYEESENLFVKCIDHLTNYEVSMMIDYINDIRGTGPKDPSQAD